MPGILEPLLPYTVYLAFVLRAWVGINFMAHGYPKLGKSRQQVVDAMKAMGVPAMATYGVVVLEFFGGLLLVIGLFVPVVALLFAIEMVSTTILKKSKMKGPYLSGQNPAAYEIDITYFLLALVLMFIGAGAFSIDSAATL